MNINVNDSQLLDEVQKGNLKSVTELLKEGANVNYQDLDGNTPLHYAVRYGYLDLVKLLLRGGADINIENYEVESPLDVANKTSRLNIDDILMMLHKTVIDKSFKILEKFVEEEAQVGSSEGVTEKIQKNSSCDSSFRDEIVLKEIANKEGKMKSCLRRLKTLNKSLSVECAKINYEQANILVYFLEAFAFQDLYIKDSGGSETEDEIKIKIQDHFAKYISEFRDGRRLIDEVRTLLCYNSKTVIALEDTEKLICSGINIKTFFKTLENYVQCICNKIDHTPNRSIILVDITSILQMDETIGKHDKEFFMKEWDIFISAIHNEEQWSNERAQEILFSFLVNISPAIEKHATGFQKIRNELIDELPDLDIKKKFTEIFSSKIYSHLLYAEIFNKIKEKGRVIKSILQHIKSLNKEADFSCAKFSYKQANILILFLNAFALGVGPSDVSDVSKYIVIIQEVDKHFEKFIPGFNSNQILIKEVREILCCNSNQIITLEDIGKMVCPGIEAKSFFKNMEEYVRNVCDLLDGSGDNKIADLNSFLMPTKTTGEQSNDLLKELLGIQIGIVNGNEEWTTEKTQKLLFNFLVNVTPSLRQQVIGLRKLRNNVIDTFREFYDVEDILKTKLTKTVFQFRSLVFKYYYAKEAVEKFHQIKPEEDCSKIDDNLRKSLKEFEDDFEESYKGPSDNKLSSTEDIYRFETLLFQASLYPELEDLALTELVREYFKYMTILDDQTTKRYYEFPTPSESFNIRRILLRYFWELKYYKTSIPNKYFEEKKDIREVLKVYSGVKEIDYNDVCQLYIENDSLQNQGNKYEDEIIIVVKSLRRIQRKFKCSNHAIITLYRRVVEQKQEFEFGKNADLFKNCTISDVEKAQLNRELKELYKDDTVELFLNDRKLEVNITRFVSNILKTFYCAFNSYQVKYDNLLNCFNDEIVLQNMTKLEKTFWKTEVTYVENPKFCNYLLTICEKMLINKYTAPFITKLNIEAGTCSILLKRYLIKLTEVLLDEDSYIDHLNDLLKVDCEVDLYEIVWKKIPEMNLENLRPIFEDPVHVKMIFNHLQKSMTEKSDEKLIKLEEDIMRLLYNIANSFFALNIFIPSLEILEIYTGSEFGCSKLEILKGKYLKLRIRNWQGILLKRRNETHILAAENCRESLEACYELKSALDDMSDGSFEYNALYLINLSILAYTLQALEKYDESFRAYKKLFLFIKHYTLHNASLANIEPIIEESYTDILNIIKCQKYIDLLRYFNEDSVFLDITKIRVNMAWQLIWFYGKERRSLLSPSAELEFYMESISEFKKVYRAMKLDEPPDPPEIADIMWKIGFMLGNLSRMKEKIDDRRELFRYKVESLHFYNGAYHYHKGYSDTTKTLQNIFRILHILARNKNSVLGWDGIQALQRRLNNIREPVVDVLDVTKYVEKYRRLN